MLGMKYGFGVSIVLVTIMTVLISFIYTYNCIPVIQEALDVAVNRAFAASSILTGFDGSNRPNEHSSYEIGSVKHGINMNEHTTLAEQSTKTQVIVVFNPDHSSSREIWQYYNATLANECAYTNCRLTMKKTNLRNQSAILFILTDAPKLPLKPPLSQSERRPDQVWIFSWLESPIVHLQGRSEVYKNQHWRDAVNWTMSYIHDADIDFPYGHLTKQPPPVRNYGDIFRKKSKMAAWLVSHCKTQSKREDYVEKLKEAGIDVDIYGRCAGKRVDKYIIRRRINNEYKFYLAFENAFCKDYISEKFFSYFQLDIIPVVRGGGNYSNASPDETFINTADFASIKALAEYLKKVASSEELYTKYLRAKDKYASPERLELRRHSYCEICKRLNNLETYRRTYTDLVPRINNGTCFEPKDLH